MVAMWAVLAMKPPIDGEGAVAIARRFLLRMGARPLGINALVQQDGHGWRQPGKVWAVGFDLAPKGWFSVNVNERGAVHYACRNDTERSAATDRNRSFEQGRRLMARVPDAVRVRQDAQDPYEFHALVDGRRYFNMNPTYGYRIMFDADGALTWFGRQDAPPPPAVRVARVDRATATAKLTRVWKAQDRVPTWPEPRHVETELGYYAVKGEPKARLVWRGEVFSESHGRKTQFSDLDTFVDAATGALVKADDR